MSDTYWLLDKFKTTMIDNDDVKKQAIAQAVETLLIAIDEDPQRDGLKDTPQRVARAWLEWTRGYRARDFSISTFETKYSGIVARRAIPFQSFCEHHLSLYSGTINFGYIPNGSAIGLSKIIRLFQHEAARLTIQENLTDHLIDEFLSLFDKKHRPKGAIIIVEAMHSCEATRGIRVSAPTITSAVRGVFAKKLDPREEFLQIIERKTS